MEDGRCKRQIEHDQNRLGIEGHEFLGDEERNLLLGREG